MVRPDGAIIDYAAMPLPDGATLFTFADVTDSKRYERALEERNDALVAGDRMKNAFISHVSYELRTPLTNIIGFSDLLGNPHIGPLNEKQHEYLGDISASSKTLLAIIDDILTLATMDAGTMELKLAPVDVPAVIDAAILGIREAAQRARLSLHIAVAEDATHFIADEARVRQILFNLLVERRRLLQARRHRRHHLPARRRHAGVRRRGPGRRHPEGPAVEGVRPVREPQPWLKPPRRRPRPVDRQKPCRAARRHRIARIRAGARHTRHCAPSRARPA